MMFCLLSEGGKAQRQALNIFCNTPFLFFFPLLYEGQSTGIAKHEPATYSFLFFSCSVCSAFMLLKPTEMLCFATGTVANNSFKSKGN